MREYASSGSGALTQSSAEAMGFKVGAEVVPTKSVPRFRKDGVFEISDIQGEQASLFDKERKAKKTDDDESDDPISITTT
eukprot:9195072-Pyramimonas_sp.AAC.1